MKIQIENQFAFIGPSLDCLDLSTYILACITLLEEPHKS